MNIVVLLSLCAALTYGLSDFVGGLLTRRVSVCAVAATSQATAALLALALMITNSGQPETGDVLWGVLAGVGSGAGNVFIYRGLGSGSMAVVAPLSAVAAATLPLAVGLALGEQPGLRAGLGMLMALPAIWLVAGGGGGLRGANGLDAIHGLLAGCGFGVQFSALGQVSAEAGWTPLVVSQVISVVAIVTGATVVSAPWLPRDRLSRLGAVAGALAGVATLCFQFAVQHGPLTIASVLTALYPAVTVLLAAVLLRERVQQNQGVGLLLAAIAVTLITIG